ncbi:MULTISPECIES: hypothetical protein [Agromyces]|uniref:hypothetical protein n=1 Tax=Agromyces TaxID=33877 RepID=UPI001E4D4B88|nr:MULTISPECIES: hypothetical protein [Agromyces]MCD1571805.1 hypothetical protein [Agromyces mediolanus]GLU90570.1 hypothetical protein Agsp01_28250 [Agromyces sp. NBRC 114283]
MSGLHSTIERSFRRPARSARAAVDMRERHGGRRMSAGITIAAAVLVAGHFAHLLVTAGAYPAGRDPWAAWIALAVVLAGGVVSRLFSPRMPSWVYLALFTALAVPVGLDLVATQGLLHLGVTPTAAAASAVVLMPVTTLRGHRVPVVVAGVVGAAIAIAALVQLPAAGSLVVVGVAVAVSAVLPVVVAALAIVGFRRLVGRELDLSLVQSTVQTPRSAVGMRASEELARLDFDAESLLEDVGSGRLPIPLPTDAALRAGALAAKLRVRLIEGRSDTWLKHAVTESAYLSRRVTIDDPDGDAGVLAPAQRDGLLLALWLIAGERRPRRAAGARVVVRVRSEPFDDDERGPLAIEIEVSGVARRHLDPAIWDALGSLGSHEVVSASDSIRIELVCPVDPNAPAAASAPRSARTRGR